MSIAEVPEFFQIGKSDYLSEACAEYLKSHSCRCVESEQAVSCRFP